MSIIICGGLRRTSSLGMFQVMREIVERRGAGLGDLRGREINQQIGNWVKSDQVRVLKFHRYRAILNPYMDQIKVVMTIRDPRDVVVSIMNRRSYDFDTVVNSNSFTLYVPDYYRWMENVPEENLFLVQYERFWQDRESVIGYVAEFMGFSLTSQEIEEISQKWSIEANIERAKTERHIDDPDHVASSHIHSGQPGQWQSVMTQDQVDYICRETGDWMEEIGYLC